MGFVMQLFSDPGGTEPFGEPENTGFAKLHDSKMRAREWLNSRKLMAVASQLIDKKIPVSVSVIDSQGGVAFHDNDLGPTRKKVMLWRDALNARDGT